MADREAQGNAPFTVGHLLDELARYDRSTLVVIEVSGTEYHPIERVNGPLDNAADVVEAAVSICPGEPLPSVERTVRRWVTA